jgi:hypothetical protein
MAEAQHEHSSRKTSNFALPPGLIETLDLYLVKKAPFQLSHGVREWIVTYGPWIQVVLLVLMAPGILLLLGLGAAVLPLAGLAGPHAGGALGLAALALIVQVALMIMALPGLFARKIVGWNFAFYGVLFSLANNLLRFDIVGGLLGALIAGYVLFQIRPLYK